MNDPLPFPAVQLLEFASLAKLLLGAGFSVVTALFLFGLVWQTLQYNMPKGSRRGTARYR